MPNTTAQTPPSAPEEPIFKNNLTFIIAVAAIIIGIGIGLLGAHELGITSSETIHNAIVPTTAKATPSQEVNLEESASDTKAADLRVLLNALYRQHINLLMTAIKEDLGKDADYQATNVQLTQNTQALATVLGSIYGTDAESRFTDAWKIQNDYFISYAGAVKSKNPTDKEKALSNLRDYENTVSDLYSNLNPSLPKAGILSLVNGEVTSLTDAINAYVAKDYDGSYTKVQDASNQTGSIADTLSNAIVKQFPEKY